MDRIRYYSDDSYAPCGDPGRQNVVTAGVAVQADRRAIQNALVQIEHRLNKHKDWHRTPPATRTAYIDAVRGVDSLTGRVFYWAFDGLRADEYWDCRLLTLERAIAYYSGMYGHQQMMTEGLTSASRLRLRRDLATAGVRRVTVEPAAFAADPIVRLSDALAGYVRSELFRGAGGRAALHNLPDSFVNLELETENPPGSPGG